MAFVTTDKATGICRIILKVVTTDEKWWCIYNPFKRQIQTLEPQQLNTEGNLYKHEKTHEWQHERMGTLKFCFLVVWYCIHPGYDKSPLELEAREAEAK